MSDKKKILDFINEHVSKIHELSLLKEEKVKLENELKEYDNYNYPAGADADRSAPWHEKELPEPSVSPKKRYVDVRTHDNEIAIMTDAANNDYVFYHGNLNKSDLADYGRVPGHWERDEDGGSFERDLDNWDIDSEAIEGYINDNWEKLTKGSGMQDWENGIDIVKIDDALKADIIQTFGEKFANYL